MSLGIARKTGGQEPLTVAISGPAGDSERLLGFGTHVFGGALSADVVLPMHDAPEIFSITRAVGESVFALKVLCADVLVDGMEVTPLHKQADLTRVRIASAGHSFDVQIVAAPRVSLKERIGASTSGLRSSVNKMEMGGTLNTMAGSGQSYLRDVWQRNPQGVAALLLAGTLVVLASLAPASFGSSMGSTPRALPVLPHLQPIPTQNILVEEVRRRAQAADLLPQVTVTALPDGSTVVLSGAITSTENVRLAEILINLRGRLRAPLVLDSSVAFAPPEDRHGIAGIVLVPQKAVVVESGDLVAAGETLPTGWRVIAIDEIFVELIREGVVQKIPVAAQELRRTLSPPAATNPAARP